MSKKKKKYSYSPYYGDFGDEADELSGGRYKSSWGNWKYDWGKTTYNFDSIEQKLQRKKDIEETLSKFISDNKIIAKTYVNQDTGISRKGGGLYTISVNNTNEWKSGIPLLQKGVDTWKKLPSSEKVKNNIPLMSALIDHNSMNKLEKLFMNTKLHHEGKENEIKEIIKTIKTIFKKPIINDEDVDTLLGAIPEKVKKEIEEDSKSHGGISPLVDNYDRIPKLDNVGLRITHPPSKFIKPPHLSKGKRINKGFIQKTDYRPLRTKIKVKTHKKKLLVLLDGSGSMGGTPYQLGVNFIAEIVKLGLFNVDLYQTTDKRVIKANKIMKDWVDGTSNEEFVSTADAEGFESLTQRMAGINRDEDYVLVITDMCVPDNAEENLKSFIGSKKHLILSFESKGNFGCNVRIVKKYSDMMNVVGTLLS